MTRQVGTLWIGGKLSWYEQLCLKSWVDRGQKITMFCYHDVPNLPAGIDVRDGREIINTESFLKYKSKDSYALFADLFRLHMVAKCPGMIWIDTDVYCHQPMDYEQDLILGYEKPWGCFVNNAILGMAPGSAILQTLLDFTANLHPSPPFLTFDWRNKILEAELRGEPMHVSEMAWGVWGPKMVSYYTRQLELEKQIMPVDAFYPIIFKDRREFMGTTEHVNQFLTDKTTALHIWASNKMTIAEKHDGLPPRGTYLDDLVKAHSINVLDAPISSRATTQFAAGLLDAIARPTVRRFGDMVGTGRSLALHLYHRHQCDIEIYSLSKEGVFEQDQDWIADYIAFLTLNGVPKEKIRVVTSEEQIQPVDILCNIKGYGWRRKIKHAKDLMPKMVQPGSQIFSDVKVGGGGFKVLRPLGQSTVLAEIIKGENLIKRVSVQVN